MLRSLINDPEHWRSRAEEARAVAEQLSDPQAKGTMLLVAESYDQMAVHTEARLLTKGFETEELPRSKLTMRQQRSPAIGGNLPPTEPKGANKNADKPKTV
jgi:hypothetical protein